MYLVFYTKDASPNVKEFKSLKAAEKFASKMDLLGASQHTDDWTDFIVEGKIIKKFSGSRGIIITQSKK